MHAEDGDGDGVLIHRIRHINAVNVRNLTPFPARDALANALAQPTASKQTTTVDDIELTLARRRRRISATSATTLRSVFSQESADDGVDHPKLAHRPSSASSHSASRSISLRQSQTSTLSSVLPPPDSSQRTLEKVIASRLLETYITLAPARVASDNPDPRPPEPSSPPIRNGTPAAKRAGHPAAASRRGASISSIASVATSTRSHKTEVVSPTRATVHSKTTTATKNARRVSIPISPPPTPRNSVLIPVSALQTPSSSRQAEEAPRAIFKSGIHRPSTNPTFDLSDAKSTLVESAESGSSRVVITLWGRTVLDGSTYQSSTRKGKQREGTSQSHDDWRVVSEYDLDLNDLQPVPSDYIQHPSRLPSNTLIIHLTPPDQAFFLPLSSSSDSNAATADAASDGELDLGPSTSRKRSRRKSVPTEPPTKTRETATWHDLHKLVHLQATLADTKQNLDKIVAQCDALLAADTAGPLKREVSEREERVRVLREQRDIVRSQCTNTAATIEARRRALSERRQMLIAAHSLLDEERTAYESVAVAVSNHERENAELRAQNVSRRAELLQTLVGMYPIAPLSAQDLLFSILDIPLPVPQNATDPAPPLTLSPPVEGVEVNEETVSAALGYVAQLVQLLATYLGRRLMYPVTCIGSRSLIKDPISAMMGPRMFPLYSKGVETYRFEYAVFLLNKDIELIMMDRNLRALDLRHTLPNLMNLLLTLTSPEAEPPHKHRRRPVSPQLSVRELHPAPQREDHATDSEIVRDLPQDISQASPPERRSMFSPLAAILRARYPSSAARVAVAEEPAAPSVSPEADESAPTVVPNGDATPKVNVSTLPETAASVGKSDGSRTPPASRLGRVGMFGRFMGSGAGAEEKAAKNVLPSESVEPAAATG